MKKIVIVLMMAAMLVLGVVCGAGAEQAQMDIGLFAGPPDPDSHSSAIHTVIGFAISMIGLFAIAIYRKLARAKA
jgi:uncharacterized BrkB/YihY/UPF0761 family membrane protein